MVVDEVAVADSDGTSEGGSGEVCRCVLDCHVMLLVFEVEMLGSGRELPPEEGARTDVDGIPVAIV